MFMFKRHDDFLGIHEHGVKRYGGGVWDNKVVRVGLTKGGENRGTGGLTMSMAELTKSWKLVFQLLCG